MNENENELKNAALFDTAQANLYIGYTTEVRSHDIVPSRVFFLFPSIVYYSAVFVLVFRCLDLLYLSLIFLLAFSSDTS